MAAWIFIRRQKTGILSAKFHAARSHRRLISDPLYQEHIFCCWLLEIKSIMFFQLNLLRFYGKGMKGRRCSRDILTTFSPLWLTLSSSRGALGPSPQWELLWAFTNEPSYVMVGFITKCYAFKSPPDSCPLQLFGNIPVAVLHLMVHLFLLLGANRTAGPVSC